jgi:hypothetical protein
MAMGTLCLCIIIVVSVAMVSVYAGKIGPNDLGNISKAGLGAGILGMLGTLVFGLKGLAK